MRRTTFFRTTFAAAAVSTLLLAGCGSQGGGGTAGGGSVSPTPSPTAPTAPTASTASTASTSPSSPSSPTPPASPSPTSPAAPSTSTPTPTSTPTGCADQVQLTAADDGRAVCLAKGGEVRVSLDGTKDRPWAPVTAKGGRVLEAINAGFVVLPGDANAAFRATATGTARLTSSRPLCASRPNHVACKGIQEWTVTVTVPNG